MKLNNNQKQFLFDKHYVTAKTLDACVEDGWQKYFIKNFNWYLELEPNRYNLLELVLMDPDTSEISYKIGLIFQGDDLETLKKTKSIKKKYFWVIKTIDNERSSSYKYITTSLEDAEAHRMEYCGWYCQTGDVDIIRIDENFREIETIHYWQGKVWEHSIKVLDERGVYVEDKYLVKNGRKVRK